MKKLLLAGGILVSSLFLTGCEDQATRVSRNIVNEANDFGLYRRLAVINMLDDTALFELTGFFSLDDKGDRITVTVQSGPDSFERHMINTPELVFWIVEDLNDIEVDPFTRSIVIRPEMFMNFDLDVRRGSNDD